jgi:nitrite reductase/ring-hydroxylating ferredoxin subunit
MDKAVDEVFVCKKSELKPGDGYKVTLPDHSPVAVFNVNGELYATDDTCTHGEASLSDGFLEGCVVECPFHGGTFDVRTGKALTYPVTEPLKTYPLKIEGDYVYVMVEAGDV